MNRIPVAGPDSGPFLKIDLYGFPVLSPFIQYADVIAGVVSAEPIPKGTATLVVGTNVAGYFQILSGNPFSTIEYEWRLYSDILDVGTDRHEVIGKPGGSHYPSLQEHYDDRFTSADVGVSPPTGTSAHTDPPYVLNLKDTMVNKHITFAV
ncbi:MAG: hypothetical protein Q4A13_05625, partial [Fretibacterium sp.]|nr:hypothetical protein [Fretibacterium sp.]